MNSSMQQQQENAAKLAVIELAVIALGRLALAGPKGYLSAQDRIDLRQHLFDALEVLNNEKDSYGQP